MKRLTASLALAAAIVACSTAAASAAPVTKTFRYGPIQVGGYQVLQSNAVGGIPTPKIDGFVTRMKVDITDARGKPIPIQRLMLHHIVFSNLGRTIGDRKDSTCNRLTLLDSFTKVPAFTERFYAAGKERAELVLPEGYGYRTHANDNWLMTYMVMNHKPDADKAYISYSVTYDTDPALTAAQPIWLDVRNCRADPVYNVAGGRKRGSISTVSTSWTPPSNGRLIAAGGHLHGGGKKLVLSQPDCGNRTLMQSRPLWGSRSHPFYNVKPILHEPGPINMTGTLSREGIPVPGGRPLRFSSVYDAELPHTRVMGIMGAFFVPDAAVAPGCAALPPDIREQRSVTTGGRAVAPRFTVPIVGFDDSGRAVEIEKPPGRTVRVASGTTVKVGDVFFSKPNLAIRRGGRITWKFDGRQLHNVTLASGPRGFASDHLSGGRTFTQRFTTPGRYKMFCGLHPVDMTSTVTVR